MVCGRKGLFGGRSATASRSLRSFALGTGYAVTALPKNSVGTRQVVNNSLLCKISSGLSARSCGARKGRRARRAQQVQREGAGAAGACRPGGITRYARVGLDAARTLEPNDVAEHPEQGDRSGRRGRGQGRSCSGTPASTCTFRPASAMAALDNADLAANVDIIVSVAIDRGGYQGDCPATHNDARIHHRHRPDRGWRRAGSGTSRITAF